MIKIAIVSMVKAPLHELRLFVHYHLNIGIDEIILLFDDPLDPGLEAFPQFQRVTAIACSSDYWKNTAEERPDIFGIRQITNINEGVKIALDRGCSWVIPIDSDELIKPSTDIKRTLENCNADVLRFKVMEAVSEKEDYDNIFAATLFKNESSEAKIKVAKLFGCSQAFFKNEYFRGHTASKMAVKISHNIQKHGVHGPREYDRNKTIFSNTKDISLLHFDCVGFSSWNTKWGNRHDGTCKSVTMRENRKNQLQAYSQAKQKGHEALANLYNRFQVIPGREKIVLTLIGMLQRVKLNQSLFKSPQPDLSK